MVSLEAVNGAARDPRGRPLAELLCSCSGSPLWADRLQGCGSVAQLAGSLKFAAVSTSTGDLQVGTLHMCAAGGPVVGSWLSGGRCGNGW